MIWQVNLYPLSNWTMSCFYGSGGLLAVANGAVDGRGRQSTCFTNASLVSSSSYMDISESAGAPAPLDQQKLNQTMMWQQNQYMGDSGIQSSVTTRVSECNEVVVS